MWLNYPHDINGEHQHPSSDSYATNQCAIRLGYALQLSGVVMSNYNTGPVTSEGYPRGAKSLADWLWQMYGEPVRVSPNDFEKNILNNSQGIFYQYPGSDNSSVGHIDLFNYGEMGSGYYYGYSEIWFWKIK